MQGLVFDIKRFAVHDGEGIRTTVFLKGCPLRCKWCHNPEGLRNRRRMLHIPSRCMGCGDCVAACQYNALAWADGIVFHAANCAGCGRCAALCPTAAMGWDSEWMTVPEVLRVVRRDRAAYDLSGGGVTLSGGEPTFAQYPFALEILTGLRQRGIATAVESCMHAPWEIVERFLPLVDDFIVDVKIVNPDRHLAATGAANTGILENIRRLSKTKKLLIRTPMIPGYTDDLENVAEVAAFVARLPAARLELLSFNPLYIQKYAYEGLVAPVLGTPLTRREMDQRREIVRQAGVACVET